EKVYLKNPESSKLGIKILEGSIYMIDDLGFERFTLGKLAKEIGTTEATIYRYFESKHKLLLYLISWYWGWLEYRLVFGLANINSAKEKLDRAITILTERVITDGHFSHINEVKLSEIVIAESSKAYFTKEVDNENEEGIFSRYKQLVKRVSDIILEINPTYEYPHMLVSTIMEGSHLQRYFAAHLPRLTDVIEGEDSTVRFYKELVFKAIRNK
ncbi:MAG: TetR/AcrR family transcriptional regulator, partial [Cytophagales bacterium]|nr:TetR/AcrR family transcriptional regulator [Cytophagales bacterium]